MAKGCKGRQKAKPEPKKKPVLIVGEQGLEKIKYVGWLELDYYVGETTEATYRFGLMRPEGFVDKRDVPGFLKIIEDEQKVFLNVNGTGD